jgi:hypothetical protein
LCLSSPFLLQEDQQLVEDCLDLLTDVLGRFGGYLGAQHGEVGSCVMPYLDGGRATLRKRALHALGEWKRQGERGQVYAWGWLGCV